MVLLGLLTFLRRAKGELCVLGTGNLPCQRRLPSGLRMTGNWQLKI